MRAIQTFDLHAARLTMHDCPCPNHRTETCDCQMVILLVYGKENEPVTLVLHGNNGQTWLSIADNPNRKTNARMVTAIKNALEGQLPAQFSPYV